MVIVALKSDDKGWDRIPALDTYLQVKPDDIDIVEQIGLRIP
jgi:hypothetical protein